jgi:myosin heavy subunit
LEKSRVSNAPESEKNFHIFYHLLNGMKDAELTEVFSTRSTPFAYLHNSTAAPSTSAESLDLIRKQLQLMGFAPAEQASMFKILFGILHLGNVQFEARGEESAVTAGSQTSLWNASALLGVSQPALQKALTTLDLKTSNTTIALNKANAELSRDSLAKDIYERLFDWIVKRMNTTISLPADVDVDDYSHVSILDISGYETSSANSLEQLCINYTNDKLQQLFNTYVYKEQELYEEEGLNWTKMDIDLDLRSAISLVEKKPDGVFGILDQVCYRLDASDENLLSELALVHKTNALLKVDDKGFSIQHGPGPVSYVVGSFLVKNRDVMAAALENLMSSSKEQLLASLFTNGRPRTSNTSVTKYFCNQLSALLETIGETDCSYIKCIRPNAESVPDVFDSAYVRDQIKWCGVVETITLCDKGYPSHLDYSSFLNLFSDLPSTPRSANASPRDRTQTALQDTLKPSEYALGETKLFLAMGSHFKLDLMLESIRRQSPRDAVGHSKSFWQRTRETWGWMFS